MRLVQIFGSRRTKCVRGLNPAHQYDSGFRHNPLLLLLEELAFRGANNCPVRSPTLRTQSLDSGVENFASLNNASLPIFELTLFFKVCALQRGRFFEGISCIRLLLLF